jgi:uracil phosphoribosyltransferase
VVLTDTQLVGSPSQATLTIQDNGQPEDIVAVALLNAPVGIDPVVA